MRGIFFERARRGKGPEVPYRPSLDLTPKIRGFMLAMMILN